MRIKVNDTGLEITTNIGCINNCVFCPQEAILKAYTGVERMLSFKDFKTCIDKLPKHTNVHFSGFSEPWLNPECTRMLVYAYEGGHGIVASTTLVGMNKLDALAIKNIKFKRFMLHLPCIENYEHITVTDEYIEVLRLLLHVEVTPNIHCHGTRVDPKLDKVLDGYYVTPNPSCSRANNVDKELMPDVKWIDKKKTDPFICKNGMLKQVLLPNGDVSMCCADYGLRHILGNLLTQSYESLFESDEYMKLQNSMTDSSIETLCRWCEHAIMGEWLNKWVTTRK